MGVQQRRKNPLPVVRAAHGNGIFLLFARVPGGERGGRPVIPSREGRDRLLECHKHFQTVPHEVCPRIQEINGASPTLYDGGVDGRSAPHVVATAGAEPYT